MLWRRAGLAAALASLTAVAACLCCFEVPPDVLVFFGNGGFSDEAGHFEVQAGIVGKRTESLDLDTTDSGPFHRDASVGGDDDVCCLGLESAPLVYYIGHGAPTWWRAYDEAKVWLRDVQFGDGALRYLWMAACNPMAHGAEPFDQPHLFDATNPYHGNVFERWAGSYPHQESEATTPLTPDLRMACGGSSTLVAPLESSIRGLWERIVEGQQLSDAFIEANLTDDRVPLCITRGGEQPEATPLFDSSFFTLPNPHGDGGYVHIQYPVHGLDVGSEGYGRQLATLATGEVAVPDFEPGDPPDGFAPVFLLEPLPVPRALGDRFLDSGRGEGMGYRVLPLERALRSFAPQGAGSLADDEERFELAWQPCSGGLSLRGRGTGPRPLDGPPDPGAVPLPAPPPGALSLLRLLGDALQAEDPEREVWRRPTSLRRSDMYIDRASEELARTGSSAKRVQRFLKHHLAVLSLGVEESGRLYPVLGEAGRARLEIGVDGRLQSLSIQARRVARVRRERLLDRSEARRRAEKEAQRSGARYGEPILTWGYLEAPASCHQREMGIVYRFTFEPEAGEAAAVLVVDVPAQEVEPPICYGERTESAVPLPRGCDLGDG